MRRTARTALALLFPLLATSATAEQSPLAELPYTPSLDTASMDRTVDPCTDFYAYSCGGWQRNNPIPPDQAGWAVYYKLANENMQYLWGMLEDAAKGGAARTPAQQKIGDYFSACMDNEAIERRGAEPLSAQLAQIDALRSIDALPRWLGEAHLQTRDAGMLFGFGSMPDPDDTSRSVASADAGGIGLPDRDYYTREDAESVTLRARYREHVQHVFELLGQDATSAAADAATVLRLETELAKASLTVVERRDPYKLRHRMSPRELRQLTRHFRWKDYLAAAAVPRFDIVNVGEPRFFERLDALLASEPLADWKAYLRWHLARSNARHLSTPFADADFAFYSRTLRGIKEPPPRWKQCVRLVDTDLGEALGEVFVARAFPPETREAVRAMVGQIESAMAQEIRSLDWMSAQTRERALEKLEGVANKVGYPDHWRDYAALTITADDFHGNLQRAARFESRRLLAMIGKPVDRAEWHMTAPTVNAYYNPQTNDVNFPAGILLPPLYDARLDDAPNYGNTGSSIGHELTHAFDDEGRQFDATGNLRNWWTPDDEARFEERLQCVKEQYAGYTVIDDIRINSDLTSGEDVADLGGTLLAWIAWKQATAGKTLENRDGLTPEQRFFVGFAQWACASISPEETRRRARIDPHSPPRWRINGIVTNLPQFRDAFSCKPGSPMVSAKPCKIW